MFKAWLKILIKLTEFKIDFVFDNDSKASSERYKYLISMTMNSFLKPFLFSVDLTSNSIISTIKRKIFPEIRTSSPNPFLIEHVLQI